MAAALKELGKSAAINIASTLFRPPSKRIPTIVFLGPPGVGKGTYSSRISKLMGFTHISVGDLIRSEIQSGTSLGQAAAQSLNRGDLLSDEIVFELLQQRMKSGRKAVESTFLLDGFPRTAAQTEALLDNTDVQIAVNLHLREDVLLQKCLGRRICSRCGENYNVADINLPAEGSVPAVVMPPLSPKTGCKDYLVTRSDDNESIFKHRMEVYKKEATPVEELFRKTNLLLEFQIKGGIPETMPSLVEALSPYGFTSRGLKSQLKAA